MAIRNKGHYLVFQMERALLIIEKSDLAKDAVMSIQFLRFWSGPKFIQSWAWSETGKGAVLSFTKVPNCTWSGAIQKWRGKHGCSYYYITLAGNDRFRLHTKIRGKTANLYAIRKCNALPQPGFELATFWLQSGRAIDWAIISLCISYWS